MPCGRSAPCEIYLRACHRAKIISHFVQRQWRLQVLAYKQAAEAEEEAQEQQSLGAIVKENEEAGFAIFDAMNLARSIECTKLAEAKQENFGNLTVSHLGSRGPRAPSRACASPICSTASRGDASYSTMTRWLATPLGDPDVHTGANFCLGIDQLTHGREAFDHFH